MHDASRAARNESPSPSPPAKPPKGVPAQSGAAQRPQQQPSPQRPKSAGEPLPSTKSFQATKFDKFMVAITAMDGVPFEDGWVSLERRDCLAACKSAGVDISRSELKSFCDYACDYLRVDGTRILHKPKKS